MCLHKLLYSKKNIEEEETFYFSVLFLWIGFVQQIFKLTPAKPKVKPIQSYRVESFKKTFSSNRPTGPIQS